jgi:hypothetical protein
VQSGMHARSALTGSCFGGNEPKMLFAKKKEQKMFNMTVKEPITIHCERRPFFLVSYLLSLWHHHSSVVSFYAQINPLSICHTSGPSDDGVPGSLVYRDLLVAAVLFLSGKMNN